MPGFDNLGTKILEMIRDWLVEIVEIFINFLQNILFNYDGLGGIALQAYDLFVWFGGLLLVSVALGKVITQLVGEAEGSQEANIWHTVVGSLKAGVLLVVMPFIVSILMKGIIKPFTDYFIGLMGSEMIESVNTLLESEDAVDVFSGMMGQIFIWGFVMVVVGFFIFKMFVEQAQLLMDEILSPLVAISVVSESFSFIENWWRDIISHAVTIVVLTLSMALFVEALTMETSTVWAKFPALFGTGALVIAGPSLVKSIWFSSGVGRTGQSAARSAMHLVTRRAIK